MVNVWMLKCTESSIISRHGTLKIDYFSYHILFKKGNSVKLFIQKIFFDKNVSEERLGSF